MSSFCIRVNVRLTVSVVSPGVNRIDRAKFVSCPEDMFSPVDRARASYQRVQLFDIIFIEPLWNANIEQVATAA